jgi:hypothetical protein
MWENEADISVVRSISFPLLYASGKQVPQANIYIFHLANTFYLSGWDRRFSFSAEKTLIEGF